MIVKVPVPTVTIPPVPVMPPVKVVVVLSPPSVSIALPSVTTPLPERLAIVWSKLWRSRTAPPARHHYRRPGENALVAPACSVAVLGVPTSGVPTVTLAKMSVGPV